MNDSIEKWSIAILDDKVTSRIGLRAILDEEMNITVLTEVSSGRDLIESLRSSKPDAIVISTKVHDVNTSELVTSIRDISAHSKILVIDSEVDPVLAQLLRAGKIDAYLTPKITKVQIQSAIGDVLSGKSGLSSPNVDAAMSNLAALGPEAEHQLSERDIQLLGCLAQGLTNDDIANKLNLSVGTVRNYLSQLYHKIGVGSRTKAAIWAKSIGLGARSG